MENQNNLQLNEQAVSALRESAKWSYFLSILGFIGVGFMVIAAFFVGSIMSMAPNNPYGEGGPFAMMKGFLSVFYIIIAVLYFFPILYLYRYASGMKQGLSMSDSETVSNALVNLKSHHKFLGITAIVVLSLYFLVFIGAIVAGIAFAGSSAM
jgi:Na+/H+ antiporter NhaB